LTHVRIPWQRASNHLETEEAWLEDTKDKPLDG